MLAEGQRRILFNGVAKWNIAVCRHRFANLERIFNRASKFNTSKGDDINIYFERFNRIGKYEILFHKYGTADFKTILNMIAEYNLFVEYRKIEK